MDLSEDIAGAISRYPLLPTEAADLQRQILQAVARYRAELAAIQADLAGHAGRLADLKLDLLTLALGSGAAAEHLSQSLFLDILALQDLVATLQTPWPTVLQWPGQDPFLSPAEAEDLARYNAAAGSRR